MMREGKCSLIVLFITWMTLINISKIWKEKRGFIDTLLEKKFDGTKLTLDHLNNLLLKEKMEAIQENNNEKIELLKKMVEKLLIL